jgi:hypothetical protein
VSPMGLFQQCPTVRVEHFMACGRRSKPAFGTSTTASSRRRRRRRAPPSPRISRIVPPRDPPVEGADARQAPSSTSRPATHAPHTPKEWSE